MPTIKIKDVVYYYELRGKGKPVVFIAGFGADHLFWELFSQRFSRRYQVLLFDNRAVGQTRDDDQELTAEGLADETLALCGELGLDKPHVVGHSLGGGVAQSLAARNPDRIDRLVLLNTVAKWGQVALHALNSNVNALREGASLDCQLGIILPWLFGKDFLADERAVAAFKAAAAGNPHLPSVQDMQRQYELLVRFDSRSLLQRIEASTLVVMGEEDLLALPHETEVMARAIPKTKLVRVKGGHASPLEQPDETSEAVLDFLGR